MDLWGISTHIQPDDKTFPFLFCLDFCLRLGCLVQLLEEKMTGSS